MNPDAPQLPVRLRGLQERNRVVVPTPRLCGDFVLLDPKAIPPMRYRAAALIGGMFRLGRIVSLERLPHAVYTMEERNRIERFTQGVKDRTECFGA